MAIIKEEQVTYQAKGGRNIFSLMQAAKAGISFNFFIKLVKKSPLDLKEWTSLLHLTDRTMQRYKKEGRSFDQLHSERILELSMLFQYGEEVFESRDHFSTWLDTVSPALDGQKPINLLHSSFGITIIKDELSRIEQGILA